MSEQLRRRLEIQIDAIETFAKIWEEEPNLYKKTNIYTLFNKYIYIAAEANSYIDSCNLNEELINILNERIKERGGNMEDNLNQFFDNSVGLIKASFGYRKDKGIN